MPLSSVFRYRVLVLLVFGLLVSALPPSAYAQESGNGAVRVGGGDALTIGGLLQTDAYLGRAGANDGFRVRTTRLRLGGEAQGLEYVVQTDFASSSVLLDAFARLPLNDQIRVTAGLFKAPFGQEILTGRPDLLFAERSRAANEIPPGRQPGVTLAADLGSDQLTATIGAFNGTRGLQSNDNDLLLYVGRLDGTVPVGSAALDLGINAGYSVDDDVARPGTGTSFAGRRFLFGADARLSGPRWLVTGELNGARLAPRGPAETRLAFGYYLAAGYDVAEDHQVLARFDQYDPDVPGSASPDNRVALGYNFDPTSMLRFLVNYETSVNDVADGVVTARLQVALR